MLAKTQIHSNSDARTNVAIVDTSTSHNSTGILTALSVNARGGLRLCEAIGTDEMSALEANTAWTIAGKGKRDPEQRFRECQQRCQRQEEGQQQRQCQQRCQQEYRREIEQEHQGTGGEETNPQKREENNPYLFESHRWMTGYRSSHGHLRVLEKFTQRSELFRGIEKFRVAVAEFEPQSFMMPHHTDGEAIYIVVRGQGTIGIANQDEKNSFNMEKGDAIRVPSGSTTYFINRDNKEKLFVYVLSKSAGLPGEVRQYFGAGGVNPESFYRAISSGILEKSFNERPLFGNRLGQFIVAPPEKFQQLRDLDVAIGFMNISQGAMVIPSINTRITGLILIVEGSGYFELQCPHLGSQKQGQGSSGEKRWQEEQEGNVHYQKVGFPVNVGDLVVVPVGHPMTFVANKGSNLRMVGFGINGQNSKVNFLVGKQSIWSDIETEAKELAFNMPTKEVEEIFQKQEESYFVPGPEQRERGEEGRWVQEHHLSSILDFVF
ncbi:hypothetical protein FXO38_26983 [Capsicum annuum]|uniref:Cupin type-1 domain-containing protein n=1 Tax=Capsicum annuum TaxID=4072 RepID=A0A2G2ZV79_CAPAN|nr:hypothetical protein FXO37_32519 [Capsicum annuum]KAF3630748.1 hypothetical protein FXO38_26983 [Capsicum annuum]PHT85888.1 hypothetical protein T459_07994 [Capsicum annuum]